MTIYINIMDDSDLGNVRAFASIEKAAFDLFDADAPADEMQIDKNYICTMQLNEMRTAISQVDVTNQVYAKAEAMIVAIQNDCSYDAAHRRSFSSPSRISVSA